MSVVSGKGLKAGKAQTAVEYLLLLAAVVALITLVAYVIKVRLFG
jgi:uncharacterized protein (UPF0333 family)